MAKSKHKLTPMKPAKKTKAKKNKKINKPVKNGTFVTATIKAIKLALEKGEDDYNTIGDAVGVSFQTVRRLAQGLTPKPDANVVQAIYEYLDNSEISF